MRATRKQVLAAIEKAGAEFDSVNDTCSLIADLPAGKVWRANGEHSISAPLYDDEPKAEAWGDLLEQINYGVDDCENDECEVCGGGTFSRPDIKQEAAQMNNETEVYNRKGEVVAIIRLEEDDKISLLNKDKGLIVRGPKTGFAESLLILLSL